MRAAKAPSASASFLLKNNYNSNHKKKPWFSVIKEKGKGKAFARITLPLSYIPPLHAYQDGVPSTQ